MTVSSKSPCLNLTAFLVYESNLSSIKSFLLVYEAVQTTTTNDQVGGGAGGILEVSFGCEFFYVDRCVFREWVVGGGK